MSALLSAVDITAGFPGQRAVLERASLELRPGRRVALLGANGSGKTTLLRTLSGALRPQGGQVLADGNPLGYSRADLARHRRFCQLVLQDPDDQLFSADVTQDVSFGPLNQGLTESQARARVAEALALLSIEHLAGRPTHQLSYGERKRVAIAGAVAMRPAVLLLDEPTAGLDPAGIAELMGTLDALSSTVVLATHDVDLALTWADEVAIVTAHEVRQGSVRLLGDQELLAAARLRRPWQLELAARLGLSLEPLPRSVDEIVEAIEEAR